jgi:hypothetical protein
MANVNMPQPFLPLRRLQALTANDGLDQFRIVGGNLIAVQKRRVRTALLAPKPNTAEARGPAARRSVAPDVAARLARR